MLFVYRFIHGNILELVDFSIMGIFFLLCILSFLLFFRKKLMRSSYQHLLSFFLIFSINFTFCIFSFCLLYNYFYIFTKIEVFISNNRRAWICLILCFFLCLIIYYLVSRFFFGSKSDNTKNVCTDNYKKLTFVLFLITFVTRFLLKLLLIFSTTRDSFIDIFFSWCFVFKFKHVFTDQELIKIIESYGREFQLSFTIDQVNTFVEIGRTSVSSLKTTLEKTRLAMTMGSNEASSLVGWFGFLDTLTEPQVVCLVFAGLVLAVMVVGGLCYWFINHKPATVTENNSQLPVMTSASPVREDVRDFHPMAPLTTSKVTVTGSPTTTVTEPRNIIVSETTPTPSGAVSNVPNVSTDSIPVTPVKQVSSTRTRTTRGDRQKIVKKEPVELDDTVKSFVQLTDEELRQIQQHNPEVFFNYVKTTRRELSSIPGSHPLLRKAKARLKEISDLFF